MSFASINTDNKNNNNKPGNKDNNKVGNKDLKKPPDDNPDELYGV